MSSFQDWVSDSFRPCCLVYCSEKAKQIIAQNNLTPSEFLRPFGDFRGKKIQIQINEKEKEPITINNFILDFYDNDKFKVLDKDSIENYLNTMFKINEPIWNLSSPLITKYHSDEQAVGHDAGLTEAQIKAADVNKDDKFDAVDASYILIYSTMKGTGQDVTLEGLVAGDA